MLRLIAVAGTLAFLGACSSGGGCDGGSGDNKPSSGQSASLPGGASSHGGPGETVSFQGLGKKTAGDPPRSVAGARTAAAAAALGGSGSSQPSTPPQSVICGGFPNLPSDCLRDPAFDAVKQKCCPTGFVERCQGIPGGARLTGSGCTAPVH